MTNWDLRFIEHADSIAQWSKDRSRKVGATIVKDKTIISVGYNGFPRGCNDDVEARHERPLKYEWVSHAEENAIVNAARNGVKLKGSKMYLNWFPCARCAGMIVNAGIKEIICDMKPDLDDPKFGESFKIALQKLSEGKVKIKYLNYKSNR